MQYKRLGHICNNSARGERDTKSRSYKSKKETDREKRQLLAEKKIETYRAKEKEREKKERQRERKIDRGSKRESMREKE